MEGPLLPGVGESYTQYEYKNGHLHKAVETEAPVDDSPGVEKRRFDVEDKEQQREHVIANRKRTPRVRNSDLAGLVALALRPRPPAARRDEPRHHQRRRNETNDQQDEQAHVHVQRAVSHLLRSLQQS